MNPLRVLEPNAVLLNLALRLRIITNLGSSSNENIEEKTYPQLISLLIQMMLATSLAWLFANTIADRGLRGASVVFVHENWLLQGDSLVITFANLACIIMAQVLRFSLWVLRASQGFKMGSGFYLVLAVLGIGLFSLYVSRSDFTSEMWLGNTFQFSVLWIFLSAVLFLGLGDLRKTKENFKNYPRLH
jgi:hypothetical protein